MGYLLIWSAQTAFFIDKASNRMVTQANDARLRRHP